MTEDKARTKVCRVAYPAFVEVVNDHANIPTYARCIASDCMMWVVKHEFREDGSFKGPGGYCGLAR